MPYQEGDTEFKQTEFFSIDRKESSTTRRHEPMGAESASIYSLGELKDMPRENLIAHTVSLQSAYIQLENDNRFQAWEFREFQKNLTYFSRVAKLANRLNAASIETISDLAINELPSYFNCRLAVFFIYNSDTETLYFRSASSECPMQSPLSRERDGDHFLFKLFLADTDPYVAEYDSAHHAVIPDGRPEFKVDIPLEWLEFFGHRCLVFPLTIKHLDSERSDILGGIIVGNPKGSLELKDADLSTIFGNLFSSSLHNAMLVDKLNAMTIIDPLTQLFNRRHLLSQLGSAMTHAKRQKHDLSIAMLDIAHFKRFNDNYGHLCGDKVLRMFADRIKTSIRADIDIPARYGGEEFIIIMPYTGIEQAMMVAERVRSEIEMQKFNFTDKALAVTCSIGVAEYSQDKTMEEFIDRADMVLYNAKRGGRTRVVAASAAIYRPGGGAHTNIIYKAKERAPAGAPPANGAGGKRPN